MAQIDTFRIDELVALRGRAVVDGHGENIREGSAAGTGSSGIS